jgi:hypothetical protein
LLYTSVLASQVFVVDGNNGTGTHFTDLPTAAAMVPDGSTLVVRPGLYAPFTITGKGLKVVGEPGMVIFASATPLNISATQPNQPILLRNIDLSTALILTNCSGTVVVENCREGIFALASAARGITITGCRNVLLHASTFDLAFQFGGRWTNPPFLQGIDSRIMISRSTLVGDDGSVPFGRGRPGKPAITLTRSRCLVIASTVEGGNGGAGHSACCIGCWDVGAAGGTGCSVDSGSTLLALGTNFIGGDGGRGASASGCHPCTAGGSGGSGVDVSGAAILLGGGFVGGTGGSGGSAVSPCQDGARGMPQTGTGAFHIDAGARSTSGWIIGTQERGQAIQFSLGAPAGSPAVLVLSYSLDLVPLEPLAYGSLLAAPAVVVGPYVVGGTGVLSVPWTLPGTLHLGALYGGQFLSLDPMSRELRASNTFPILVHR